MSNKQKKLNLLQKLIAKLNELFNETGDEGGSGGSGPLRKQGIDIKSKSGELPKESANKAVLKVATDSPYLPLIELVRSLIRAAGLSQEKYPGKKSLLSSILPEHEADFATKQQRELQYGKRAEAGLTETETPEPEGKHPSHRKTPPRRPRL